MTCHYQKHLFHSVSFWYCPCKKQPHAQNISKLHVRLIFTCLQSMRDYAADVCWVGCCFSIWWPISVWFYYFIWLKLILIYTVVDRILFGFSRIKLINNNFLINSLDTWRWPFIFCSWNIMSCLKFCYRGSLFKEHISFRYLKMGTDFYGWNVNCLKFYNVGSHPIGS